MNKIAIIGANEFQNPLIIKAKEMGFETHVFAWRANDIGEETADYFYPISITEKEKICEICERIGICAVASVGSDLAVLTVNYIARKFNFPANPVITDTISTNKYLMRKALRSKGLATPNFALAEVNSIPESVYSFKFPIIVKPTDRSGSRGIYKIDNKDELENVVQAAAEQSFEHRVIIEEFIEGDEFSCESISFNGKHSVLAVTRKFTTGAPHYIETGHIEPSGLNINTLRAVDATVVRALDSLQIRYGASHAEFKIDKAGNVRIIEIGSRMGGDCIGTDLVFLSTGNDYIKMVIDVACGIAPKPIENVRQKKAEVRFIIDEESWSEYQLIKSEQPNRVYRTSEKIFAPKNTVSDSSTRGGFYILTET